MLQGAPLPAIFCFGFPKFFKFYLKGICICEWECVPLSGNLSGRLYINTPGLGVGGEQALEGQMKPQWGWGRGAVEVEEPNPDLGGKEGIGSLNVHWAKAFQ